MSEMAWRTWLGTAALVGSIAGAYACSGTESGSNTFGSGSGGSAGTGGAGSGGSATDASAGGDGSAATGGTDGGGMFVDSSLGDGSITPESACAATAVEAEVLPLDLYIMADRSASMKQSSRWTNQSSALNTFFADPQSHGLFVALRFFPLDDTCFPQDSSCSGNAYTNPLVPWGELPGHASTLTAAVGATTPEGCFTPTQEALNGVLKGAYQRQTQEPLHVVAAVIVSDGTPCCGDCVEDPAQLGQIAAGYANGTPSIKTFAIYVADSASEVMSAIAHDGGTGSAYDATAGQQAFIDALNDIRGSMLACEYKMPETDAGKINPELVQVEYTPGGATDAQKVDRVDDLASCVGGQGWYYDDNVNPTKLIMCPGTCDMLQNDENGKVQILLGCSDDQT